MLSAIDNVLRSRDFTPQPSIREQAVQIARSGDRASARAFLDQHPESRSVLEDELVRAQQYGLINELSDAPRNPPNLSVVEGGIRSATLYRSQVPSLTPVKEEQPLVPSGTFADQVRGQERKPTLDMDMALIAEDVYKTDSTGKIGAAGWSRVSNEDLLAAGIDPENLSSDATGFQSQIYTDGNGRYVLAFAGTDPTSVPDWLANGGQGLGFSSAQYNQAVALAQDAAAAYGDNLAITGHSLGGGLASAASLATGNPAVTFNAAGLSAETIRNLGFTPNQAHQIASDGQIRRYNVQNDILTGAQQGTPLPDALGTEYRIANPNFIKDPVRAHFMGTVISGMESGRITAIESSPANNAIERVGEAGFDVFTGVVRESAGLVGDTVGVGKELVGDAVAAGRDAISGRPIDAAFSITGDIAEAGLQTAGNVVNRGLNVAGDVVKGGGNLVGGWIRDAGELVGLQGAGNTVGGWVEQGAQWLGDGLDTVGSLAEKGLDTVGGWVSDGMSAVGDAAQGAWNAVKESKVNPLNWF